MGKSKKKKFRASKQEPTGLASVKDTELANAEEFMPTAHGTVASIIEELQSINVETRECGCSTLANLVSQPDAIPVLLKHNVVKIVAPLIVDDNPHIRHVALGALRNLSVGGGHDVCEEMVQKDVLTPLTILFHKYGANWKPNKSDKTAKHIDSLEDIFTEAVHLLWNLCESTDSAVTVFNKEIIIQYLVPCLQAEAYSFATAIAVAQCLHTVTENNKMAAAFCQTGEVQAMLYKLLEPTEVPESILLSTLVAGIVINISELSCPQLPVSIIVQTLGKVLSVDVSPLIVEAAQSGRQTGDGDGDHGDGEIADSRNKDTDPCGKLKEVDHILTAQQIGLQIIANICCSEDDDWEDFASNESSSSDDMTVDNVVEESDDICQDFVPLCVPTEVHSALKSNEILSKVLTKAQPVEEDKQMVLNNCQGGHKIISSLLRVQTHALLCVNNLVSALSGENLGGLSQLHTMWDGLTKLSRSTQVQKMVELLEAVTSAMRAVIQKLAELESPKFSEITIADLQFLFGLSHCNENSQVRVNAVRCVGTIGDLLIKHQTPHVLLKDIGHFLLEVIGRDSDLWVVAETLDCMFDVFGEDHVDSVVREIGLVDKLRNIAPMLKSRINSQRGRLGDHYPVITTARTNLVRFIQYKQGSHG